MFIVPPPPNNLFVSSKGLVHSFTKGSHLRGARHTLSIHFWGEHCGVTTIWLDLSLVPQ
ncbi:hypothetical protein AG1IA_08809 [Rhizoctonia solani AG-1 IA]|uniref:Uncharacterized protein n=1 Tax=Thanatephorus cucumeris (strain AG1-IA) TaxID=983506 RepID=L8WG42_THACA|nr:hypothetical protein AG1IA_08809 [Rhizoctonia solani AG-1 IA]